MKKLKGMVMDSASRIYLESVVIKGLSNTLNMLITKFRESNLAVNFSRKLDNLENPTSVNLDKENIDFVESIEVNSFSFTLNCLIQTAKEQGVTPC